MGETQLHRAGRVEAGKLRVHLLKEWSPPFPGFYLYCPSRRQMSGALRAFFVDFIGRAETAAR